MRLRISHLTSYRYDTPATGVIQMLRLTPRNHDGQYVARWRIDVSTDCRLDQHEDAFGNITHAFTADGPFSELSVAVEGEVETRDTQGVVRGAVERFPPSFFLRETVLTTPDAAITSFARPGQGPPTPHRPGLGLGIVGLPIRCAHRGQAQKPDQENAVMPGCLTHRVGGRRPGSPSAQVQISHGLYSPERLGRREICRNGSGHH